MVWSFVLLIAALLLFVVSTRQWPLLIRGAVWGVGALMLIIAAVIVASDQERGGLLRALMELAGSWDRPSDSAIAMRFARNSSEIGGSVLSLLDLFLLLGALLGVLALIAFTPGEELERITRPLAIGLVGAILGGLLAVTAVAIGFGGERREYVVQATADNVVDGDTLWISGTPLRLAGVDAPERRQTCREGRRVFRCAEDAQQQLVNIVSGATLVCDAGETQRRSEDDYPVLLVECVATRSGSEPIDVAREVVARGFAIEYRGVAGRYAQTASTARDDQRGLMRSCSLRPDVWRDNRGVRDAFEARGVAPRDRTQVMGRPGQCPSGGGTPVREGQCLDPNDTRCREG